ncbi:hypothetical protein AS156_29270 [Bradyrhizobium macuxiense]|uniref:Uncharacterized protein n=1 Tax=Bradyrhizobium macuxiense TaxID=1755647 RepID=A0A120FRQ9_9BRAD|nr:hypothetical protein [Bradyrhizobium macuxiense]KWV60471.1 hypothetical protein AS156_29270 [Bradyrhizobium macuxiense]
MSIHEIRILPPLAIARLGSSKEPLENYELVVKDPLGHRQICAAETLRVNTRTGEISESYQPEMPIKFRDGKSIRPVAPFLEVFARTDGEKLVPLTVDLLAAEGLNPRSVKWTVSLGNLKAFRRTTIEQDKILASTSFSDHDVHPLEGRCDNFLPGKTLPLGSARYIKPNAAFPEIRLRYTPAAGLVYGASETRITADGVNGPVTEIDEIVKDRVIYDPTKEHATWRGWVDPGEPTDTNPGQIYAGYANAKGAQVSWGYLDDECDGIVEAEIQIGEKKLRAFARIGAGPPAFAPDSLPIRTVADEIEQALFGPEVRSADVSADRVEDIVRRAYETVRLLNTAVLNGNPVDGRLGAESMMPLQDSNDFHRMFAPIMATTLVDNLSVVALHQTILTALKSGTPPWFVDVLRRPEEVGDLSDKGRRKMPAMMRGADARYMTLTRRQIDLIRKSVASGLFFGGSAEE